MDPRRRYRDTGETFIEVLMTVVIMGISTVAVLTALFTAASASAYHRQQANADVVTKNYAEALRLYVSNRTGDSWCVPGGYSVPAPAFPSGWSGSASIVYGPCPTRLSVSPNMPQFQTAKITVTPTAGAAEIQYIVLAPNWCWSGSGC